MNEIEYDLTDDTGEDYAREFTPLAQFGSSVDTVPGLIAGIELSSSVTTPQIIDGLMTLPATGGSASVPPAQFGSSVTIPGLVQGMSFDSSVDAPMASNGYVRVPMARYGNGGSSVTGGVGGISYDNSVTVPYIADGHIYLPPGSSGSAVDIPLAQYTADGTSSVTGLIAGIKINSNIDNPYIADGNITLPVQARLWGIVDINGKYHSFEAMENYVGSNVQVARLVLTTDGTNAIPISLNVGIASGHYMTFSLTES